MQIYANPGQSGDWWWGAIKDNLGNKKEGWFPPAYVEKRERSQPPPKPIPAPAMQQQQQTNTFDPFSGVASLTPSNVSAPNTNTTPDFTRTVMSATQNPKAAAIGDLFAPPSATTNTSAALDPFSSAPPPAPSRAVADPFSSTPSLTPAPLQPAKLSAADPFAAAVPSLTPATATPDLFTVAPAGVIKPAKPGKPTRAKIQVAALKAKQAVAAPAPTPGEGSWRKEQVVDPFKVRIHVFHEIKLTKTVLLVVSNAWPDVNPLPFSASPLFPLGG